MYEFKVKMMYSSINVGFSPRLEIKTRAFGGYHKHAAGR